jgi:hypothetical protein
MNQGIHLVDLLLWLMGGDAEVVGTSGGAAQHEIEVEDCVVAALRRRMHRLRRRVLGLRRPLPHPTCGILRRHLPTIRASIKTSG